MASVAETRGLGMVILANTGLVANSEAADTEHVSKVGVLELGL